LIANSNREWKVVELVPVLELVVVVPVPVPVLEV
jgi:hypothetical protein